LPISRAPRKRKCLTIQSTTHLRNQRPLSSARKTLIQTLIQSPAKRCFVARWRAHRRTNQLPPLTWIQGKAWNIFWLVGADWLMCASSSDKTSYFGRFESSVFQAGERRRWFPRSVPHDMPSRIPVSEHNLVLLRYSVKCVRRKSEHWSSCLKSCNTAPSPSPPHPHPQCHPWGKTSYEVDWFPTLPLR
jgi:hypothetical protein